MLLQLHDTANPGLQVSKLILESGVNELPSRPTDDEMVISYRTAAFPRLTIEVHTTYRHVQEHLCWHSALWEAASPMLWHGS